MQESQLDRWKMLTGQGWTEQCSP